MKLFKAEVERATKDSDFCTLDARFDCVYFDAERKRVIATDGHVLIRRSVEPSEGDVSGLIPADVLAYARKTSADTLRLTEKRIEVCEGTKILATFRKPEGKFPTAESCDKFFAHSGQPVAVFNPSVLMKAVEAMKQHLAKMIPDEDGECGLDMTLAVYPAPNDQSAFLIAPLSGSTGSFSGEDMDCCAVVTPLKKHSGNPKELSGVVYLTAEEVIKRGQ